MSRDEINTRECFPNMVNAWYLILDSARVNTEEVITYIVEFVIFAHTSLLSIKNIQKLFKYFLFEVLGWIVFNINLKL